MKFTIEINIIDPLFEGEEGAQELAKILHNIASDIEFSGSTIPDERNTIHLENGQEVGCFELSTL